MMPPQQHCGRVVLLGPPNAGKSTLCNQLAQRSLAMVTHKAQTTRTTQDIIFCADHVQLIMCDTPGIVDKPYQKNRPFTRKMDAAIHDAIHNAALVCYMLDASHALERNQSRLVRLLARYPTTQAWLLLNKKDKCDSAHLLAQIESLQKLASFAHIIPLNARRAHDVERLRALLLDAMPKQNWQYSATAHTNKTSSQLAADITRKQVLLQLQAEIPYTVTVETDAWEQRVKALHITQSLVLAQPGHKAIALGQHGGRIKSMSMAARKEMERIFQCVVHLYLRVRVSKARL